MAAAKQPRPARPAGGRSASAPAPSARLARTGAGSRTTTKAARTRAAGARRTSAQGTAWRIAPLTAATWPDLERLFGAKGACGGCWCMFMRLPLAEFNRGKGEGNRRALRSLARERAPGLIAYAGDEPVGWVAVAPRSEYARLANSRVLAPVPGEGVWSAPCFFVKAGHRGAGLSSALLEAAAEFARRHGASSLEGYPNANRAEKQPAAFVYTGFESTFKRAGFREIARRSPLRPILRRELASRAAAKPVPAAATLGARAVPARRATANTTRRTAVGAARRKVVRHG